MYVTGSVLRSGCQKRELNKVFDFVFCFLCVPAYLWIVALSLDSEIALIVLLGAILMCCTTRLGSLVSCSTHLVWSALSIVTFVPTVRALGLLSSAVVLL